MIVRRLFAGSLLLGAMSLVAAGQAATASTPCSDKQCAIARSRYIYEDTSRGTAQPPSTAANKTREGRDAWMVTVGEIRVNGEDIKIATSDDGTRSIQVIGKAEILLGDLRASADKIEVTVPKDGAGALLFTGNVRFQSDDLRGTAETVELLIGKMLRMHALDGQTVRLQSTKNGNKQALEAPSLQLDFQDQKATAMGTTRVDFVY